MGAPQRTVQLGGAEYAQKYNGSEHVKWRVQKIQEELNKMPPNGATPMLIGMYGADVAYEWHDTKRRNETQQRHAHIRKVAHHFEKLRGSRIVKAECTIA